MRLSIKPHGGRPTTSGQGSAADSSPVAGNTDGVRRSRRSSPLLAPPAVPTFAFRRTVVPVNRVGDPEESTTLYIEYVKLAAM
jgi:hypothetical protein